MKKNLIIMCLVCAASLTKASVTAWTFTSDTTASSYNANTLGSGVASAVLTPSDNSETISTTSDDGNPAPSLKLSGGTAINNSTITLALTLNGQIIFSGYALAFDYNRSANSPNDESATSITWTYNINGGSSFSLGSTAMSGSSEMTANSLDLSSIGSVNSSSTINFIGTLNGAVGSTSGTYFDNFSIAPVPEPAAWGAISGFGLLGICGLRTWRQRRAGNGIATA
jgi:hypothetical protein